MSVLAHVLVSMCLCVVLGSVWGRVLTQPCFQNECDHRCRRLGGVPLGSDSVETTQQPEQDVKLPVRFVLKNAMAMTYLQEFLATRDAKHIADFWMAVTTWRTHYAELESAALPGQVRVDSMLSRPVLASDIRPSLALQSSSCSRQRPFRCSTW